MCKGGSETRPYARGDGFAGTPEGRRVENGRYAGQNVQKRVRSRGTARMHGTLPTEGVRDQASCARPGKLKFALRVEGEGVAGRGGAWRVGRTGRGNSGCAESSEGQEMATELRIGKQSCRQTAYIAQIEQI